MFPCRPRRWHLERCSIWSPAERRAEQEHVYVHAPFPASRGEIVEAVKDVTGGRKTWWTISSTRRLIILFSSPSSVTPTLHFHLPTLHFCSSPSSSLLCFYYCTWCSVSLLHLIKANHFRDVRRCVSRADGCRFAAESVRERLGNVTGFVSNAGAVIQPNILQTLTPEVYLLMLYSTLVSLMFSLCPARFYNSAMISHCLVLIKFSLIPLKTTDSALSPSATQTQWFLCFSSCCEAAATCFIKNTQQSTRIVISIDPQV